MAKNYKYEKTVTAKFSIKGVLSDDGSVITYENADKDQCTISLLDCFKPFRGEYFELSVSTKDAQDLSDEFESEE